MTHSHVTADRIIMHSTGLIWLIHRWHESCIRDTHSRVTWLIPCSRMTWIIWCDSRLLTALLCILALLDLSVCHVTHSYVTWHMHVWHDFFACYHPWLLTILIERNTSLGISYLLCSLIKNREGRAASGGALAPEPPRATRIQPESRLADSRQKHFFFAKISGWAC